MQIENINGLDSESTELLQEFLNKIKNKNIVEIMPILAEFKNRLPKDKVFSDEEKNTIIEEVLSSMPDEEKNKYKMFLKTMKII